MRRNKTAPSIIDDQAKRGIRIAHIIGVIFFFNFLQLQQHLYSDKPKFLRVKKHWSGGTWSLIRTVLRTYRQCSRWGSSWCLTRVQKPTPYRDLWTYLWKRLIAFNTMLAISRLVKAVSVDLHWGFHFHGVKFDFWIISFFFISLWEAEQTIWTHLQVSCHLPAHSQQISQQNV